MHTIRKITAEYFDEFPEEVICILAEHLIDSQQDLARSFARKEIIPYLHDINQLETEYFPMHTWFPVNKLVYYRELYKKSPEYRDHIRSLLPANQMDADPDIISRTTEMAKLTAEATWAWNYLKACPHERRAFVEIEARYVRTRAYRSRWKRSGWAEGQY